jgi:hypothetical protein
MFWGTSLKKKQIHQLLAMALLALCGSARALTCSVAVSSVPMSTLYVSTGTTTAVGTLTGSCTKTASDPNQPYIYVGIDQGEPPAGRNMTRQNGTQTLAYEIYQGTTTGGGLWTTARGQNYASGNSGGAWFQMAAAPATQSVTLNYLFRVGAGQGGAPAGIYDDQLITVTVRQSNAARTENGTILQTGTFAVYASIRDNCYFSTPPATLAINYPAFSTIPRTGSSNFQISCTYNTPYTMSLATTTGTLVGLNYSLALSAPSGTGTSAPQSYTVTGTMAAGQAGTCAGATCTASQAHTLNIGF